MKLYLDNCCYNRPYDDQTQERIHLEGEAVLVIINKYKQNENGYGDYTKEKYQQPNLAIEEIDAILRGK
jgi:hypothetical protein